MPIEATVCTLEDIMWNRFIDELRAAPEKLAHRQAALRDEVRSRIHHARNEGEERLWNLETDALGRVEALLERAPEVPVVGPLADRAERAVRQRLHTLHDVGIPDYDALNVKRVAEAVREIEQPVTLRNVRRYEAEHKNRKTVLEAVDRRLAELG